MSYQQIFPPPARFCPFPEIISAVRHRAFAALACVVFCAVPLAAQPATTPGKAAAQTPLDVSTLKNVPRDFLLYRFFFTHLQTLDSFADRIQNNSIAADIAAKSAAPGANVHPIPVAPPVAYPVARASGVSRTAAATVVDDGSDARHKVKSSAGLTDSEETLIKSIGAQCMADLAAFDQTGFAAVKAIAAKYPPDVKLSSRDRAQVDKLENDREKIVTDCVKQIKQTMGPQRFAAFHAFVVGSETVNIKHRDLPVARTK